MSQENNGGQAEGPVPSKEDLELAQEVFDKLLKGESITSSVETSRGAFEVKYPLGRDFVAIDRRKAELRGGIPADQFDKSADNSMEMYASLDVVITNGPEWWKKLRSSMDCPDSRVVTELYRGYLQHFEKVRSLLQLSGNGEESGASTVPDQNKTVGGGLFQGLAFGARKKQ